jgi:diguanylate cyclase (GGDEF)-like protein
VDLGPWALGSAVAAAGLLAMVVALGVAASTLRAKARERDAMARRDPLTGLGNRALLTESADRLLAGLDDTGDDGSRGPALLLVDLDGFKDVNDTLGHAAGDEVLTEVAQQLTASVRGLGVVTRLGGDEFAVLVPGPVNAAQATVMAKQVLVGLSAGDFRAQGVGLDVRASIGVAVSPRDGRTLDELLQHADVAMYQAKRDRSGVAVYEAALDEHTVDRLGTLRSLRTAMDAGELHLRYQPVMSAGDHRLLGFEALLRWDHPERGLLLPAEFLPLAERTNLIHPLTRWVLLTATRQAAQWRAAGLDLSMAVNVSPVSLDHGLLGMVEEALALNALPADRLVLEVTESAITESPQTAREVVERLRLRGVRISVDDFGAGFTSLSQLRGLAVHQLKIDRQFVTDLERFPQDDTIIASIIDLGHRLGLVVLAEGVETAAAADRLARLKCDELQGYYFARPQPADVVHAWMQQRLVAPAQVG